MNCPKCNSDSVDQTGEIDCTVIQSDECIHDFVCFDCGCLFTIKFAPISTSVVGQSEIYYADEEIS